MVLTDIPMNWLAIIVAAVASFLFGWVWYGPLFGKLWVQGSGMSAKEAKKKSEAGMSKKLGIYFIGTLVTVYVFANLLGWAGVVSISEAIQLSIWLGIGFLAAGPLLGDILWKGRPLTFFLINMFFWIINFAIIGSVLVSL